MKRIDKFIIGLLFIFWLTGCSDDSFIEIDSLSSDGNEFFCNQKVKIWMNVHSSDLWHTNYEWSADGGTLTQPQGLDEMTWKAPNVPGTYTIRCKVTVGNKTDIREKKMFVSSYFFEKFEKSPYAFSGQSSTTLSLRTETVNGQTNGWLRANVNSSSEVNRYLNRSFGDPELTTPFSIRAKLGFESNAPTLETIKVGNKTGNTMLEYQLNCLKDPASETGFVNRISFFWYPTNVTPGFPVVPEGATSPDGSTTYNSRVSIQTRNVMGLTTTYDYYYTISKMSTFTNKNYKKVGMAIDENYHLHIFMEGEEVLTTPVISELRTLNQIQGGIFIDNWRIVFPNVNGGANRPMLYFDDAYASTTELLK